MIPRSKNKELIQNIEERRERYSIRKFSAGAASVLIGISFMGMANSQVVKADTQPASNDENHETKVSAPSTDGVNTSDANAKVVVSVNNSSSQNSDKNKAVNNAQSENDSAQTTAETKTDEAKTNTRTEQNDSTQTFDVRNAGSQGMSAQAVNDQKTADQTLKQNAEKTATTENQSKTDQKEYDTEPITNKSVTRTVTLNAPKGGSYTDKNGNKSETATQTDTINYTRKISQDKATKKWIIDTDWTADQNHPDGKFAKQEIQTFPGYKPSSSNLNIEEDEGKFYISETGVEKDADGNLKDSQYSIDFEALQETAKLNFIANDDKKTIVSSQEISGKTGDEVALSLDGANGSTKLDVPTNWKIVPNTPYPTSITIRPNASADIYVEHATTTTSEQVQVTRTITKKIQDKTIGTATQTLSFTRNQVTDTVTGQPTYTDWKSNTVDNNNNPISQYPEIDVSYTGYIPTTDKGSIINKDGKYYLAAANAETDSTGKPINTNVTVSYTADQNVKFTQVVNYMNGTTNVGSFSISGNAGETVNDVTKQIEDHVPTNYEIVPNTKVISTITFGNENPDPVNVQVQPKQTPVDPNKDPQNQIRQVTRKITIQMPGQAAQDMGTQGVTYYRSGTKDDVTGKITYGEWKVATNSETNKPFDQVWAAYNLTQAGYTPTAIDRDNNNAAVTLTNENGKIELPQVNVTPDTKSQDILVTYTANSHKYVINYVDNTTKQNVGSQTVEGKTGEKVSYTLQYPAGYKLANVTQNIPAGTITFGSNDPAASTVLVEKDSSTTPDNPDQTYTYTINYANNGQTVGSQNVTGKSGQQVQITLRVPEGYKLTNGTQYPTSYTFGNQNASTTVQVEKDSTTPVDPNQEVKQVINYVYNGQTVGSQTLTGKIGTTKDIDWKKTGKGVEPKIPEHYTLVAQKLYGQFTFHENAEPIVAQVEPKTTIIDGSKETNNRNFYRDITQTINYNYPNQKADPVVSHRIFVRNGSRNDVTGEVTYTDWVTSGGDFIARPVQNIPGYTVQVTNGDGQVVQLVNGQIPAQTVNADSPDTIYNIDYTAQTLSFKINYVSQANNQTVKSYTISGKPDETVQIDAPVPEHWQVVSGQKILAGSYKFGNEAPSDMNVLIQPQTISGNQEGQQNNPDLYQKVTETVNITGPSGETQSRDQSLVFYRSQTFDPSTNKWNYSEWQSNMSNKATTFSPVSFTNLDGYTFKVETNDGRTITPVINGNMASIENVSGLVNGTPANVTINVTYVNKDTGKPDNPDNPQADYTYTINYMNGSENVGTQEVTGKAGQQVQITLNVPNGYKLANVAQYPTSYTFGNQNASTTVQVVKNDSTNPVNPNNPDATYTMPVQYLNAADNNAQVGSYTISGKAGQTINVTEDIKKNIPTNYEIVSGSSVPTTITFGNSNLAPALIYVQPKVENVTDDPTLKNQTEKTISRQIIYKFPGQADQTTDQSVTFKRLAYKNAVTGAITYGPWSNNGTYTFNAIQLKENNGFKPDISEIPAWTVTAEGQNNTNPVVVTYTSTSSDNPDQTYTYTINYMNNGQNVGSQNITGKAGQQVQITLNVPNDYKLASGAQYPTSYTFGNQNASTTVQVEKDSSTPVDPNQEVKQVINYVYNGQTVSSQTLTGKVGTTEYIDWNNTGKGIKPQLPDHYVLVSQQLPESFTFENNAKTIDVQVTGKSVVINGDEHKDDPNYYRTVTQTINYNYPNQPSQPVVSSRTFVRNATVNEVTGEVVKYSDWSTAPDFIARPVQTIPGYTVQVTNGDGQVVQLVNGQIPAEAVNENSANTVYNVNYTAQTLSFKINYINQANNQVVQSYTISGKPDQTVTINAPIPENWQVVAGQTVPKEGDYKFGNVAPSDMNVLIEPQTISGNQQGNQDNPDLYRTVNEVVNITGPNGDTQTRTQNLAFYRSKTFDPSTSNWKYGEWQSNMSNKATTFSPVSFTNLDGYTFKVETSDDRTVTPVINGNTASIEDVSGLVNGSPTNITINVAYINKYTGKPDNPESTYTYTINYMSNGQNVGMQNVTGKAGQTVQITLNVPKGYKLANGAQVLTSYTFGTQNASTNVQVVEDNGQTPNPDQTYTYTINYLDNGQNVGTQNVTGKSGQTVQITLNLPDGYQLANGTSYPTTYTFGNQNSSTNVNVTKKSTNPDQTYSMQIQYINAQDNKQVGSFTVSGKSGQTIQLTQEIQGKVPENYEIVPNSKYPTSVTFGNSDQAPALVYVQAEQINVTDDPSLKDQTEKTISRQIVYKFPGQADQTTDQSITFKRLAYKNAVTDQITYGDWSNDGKYTFSPIQIKQQDGYTASASEIPAWTVTAEGQNDTAPVVITFTSTTPDNPDNPDQTYTYTINYVDNGQNVGTQNVTGKSGQTVQITLNVPNGYKVDGQYPTSYTFGKQNASTTVNVVKDTTPDNPGQTISGLDHKDDPSLYREVTQTITVTYPNEQPQSTTNSLIFYRTKTTKDGQTTYSKWTSNSGTADQLVYDFKEQKVTQLPGYTVNVQKDGKGLELVTKDGASYIPSQAALNANGEPENQTITITYASENLSVKINYVANNDHSKVIATQTISGKTGEHVPVNLEVPKNWQVVPNTSVPTSITITPDAKDRTVYIEHKLVTVDGRNDQSNGNLYQKVTRTIVMNYPNQKAGEATSTLEFYRIQTTDEVTGKVTYTDWTSNSVNADKQVINEYPEQNVSLDGYTATSSDVQLITKDGKQYVPATQVARNNENVPISNTIVVNYVGNEQTVEINYVNGNNLIKTQKFSGRTGQTVAVPLELPNGYEIAANVNYPTQITFGANTEKTLTIQVTPIPSGQVVGSQYVVGTIGQTVDVKASLPINWKLADGASVPSQVTIQNTDTPISVKVVSETVTINPSKPVTPGTPINSTGQTYPAGLTANDLNKTVTRTVDIVSPDGKTTTTVQKVEFSRDATLSIATGQITYGDWKAKGNKVFNAISVPVIDGYKASGKVDEVEPSADYGNQTLTITYTKVTGQQTDSDKYTPNVVNNGSVSVDVNGDLKPEDVISNKDSLPKGTTIEWSNPDQVAQDLKKAGTYKDVGVKITYPDKSTTITKVTITVQDKQSSTYTQQIIFVNQKDNKEIKSYTFEGKLTDGHAVLSVDKLKQAIEILFGDITSDAQYKNAKIVESSLPTKDIDITGPTTKPITILVNVEGTSDNRNNSGNNSNTGDNTNPINPDNPNPVNPDNNNSGNNNNNSNNSNTNNGNANNSNNNQSSNNTNNSTNKNKPNNGNNSSNIDDNSGDNGDDYDDNDSDDSNEITPKRHKSHTSSNSHAATGNTGMTVAHANNARWLASHGYVVAVGPHGEVLNYYKASNGKGRIVTIAPHGENELANSSSSSVRSAGLAGVKNANETNGNSRKGKLPQTGEKDESALIGLGLIAGAGLLGLAGDRKRKRD